jgi:hypothetical protein
MQKNKSKLLTTAIAFMACMQVNSSASASNCAIQDYSTDFPVFRNAWMPPTDTDQNYKYYPGSEFFTTNIQSLLNSTSSAGKYIFQWVNRCQETPGVSCGTNAGKKGNLPTIEINSLKHRFFFTSQNKADACTRAQLYNSMEALQSAENVLINNGVKELNARDNPNFSAELEPIVQLPDEPSTGFIDACFLYDSTGLRNKVDGVVFDYEPQANRSPARTLGLSQYFNTFLKRSDIDKEMVLWTNALTSVGGGASAAAQRNGIDKVQNGRELYDLYDRVSVLVDDEDSAAQIDQKIHDQQRVYRPRSYAELNQKMYVIVGLGEMDMNQLQQARLKVIAQNYNGVAIWHDGATADIDTNGDGNKDLTIEDCSHPYYPQLNCLVYNQCGQ